MMTIMRKVYGESRVFGEQFPQKKQLRFLDIQQNGESDERFAYRKYLQGLWKSRTTRERLEKSIDLNPNGFWESPFTTNGLRYLPRHSDVLKDLEEMEGKPILKVVSQGLAKSDPSKVDRVVFMVRHPRNVAKSQERLNREFLVKKESGEEVDLFGDMVVHSPKMFIDVSISAMRWMERHPEIPVHVVLFDDLLDDPEQTLESVFDFIGEEGDFGEGVSVIDKKLRRSYPEKTAKSNLWNDAELVYESILKMDFEVIENLRTNPRKWTNRESRGWLCARSGLTAMEGICQACKAMSPALLDDFISKADEKNAPWREIPCAFEVAFDVDNPLISIEESIQNNHWTHYVSRRAGEVSDDS